MKQTISFVTLGVADLARSRRFYKALGWQESSGSQQEVAFFQVGSLAFALFGREALADDAMVSADGSGFPGFSLAHNVASAKEVDATLLEAVSAGGKLVRPGEKAAWGGFRGYFSDPDGFLWEVCFNPFFPLDQHGFVQLPN
ncbi:VOC family protein [Methylomonas sp. LW13]|uniref:VOC family protein n=1 Tax=unclassified Methylomonas TaxID=2608980 RepID=UPI00051C09A1|nr:VOC family protein [Methylomonas sp. LW13]QBC26383.1 VOC family protein [Methylomonas sp. LW13]